MRITLVNYAYDNALIDPEELLDRYATLTGWSEAIGEAGLQVSVVQRFRRNARIVRNGVEYVFCDDGHDGDPRSSLWPRRVHREVLNLRPDIVHVNGLNVPIQTWLLRRVLSSQVAIVVQDHGGDPPVAGAWFRRAVKRAAMRAADAFFFTAAAQAEAWRRDGLMAANQPVLLVLEASTSIRPMDRSAAKLETGVEGDPAVLWVGRLNANKDPMTILTGFERSLSRLSGAVLTMIYGTDDLLRSVEERLQASPALAGKVKLVGTVPHERMAAFYSAADVFVLGSHHEGMGYALIEACASGLPPVVTDIPAFRVITLGGYIGALWPIGDASAFANALVAVAASDRSTARRRVLDHFDRALSWPAVARQAVEAYEGVLAAVRVDSR